MDARLVLQKIRQRGITITAIGNLISLVPIRLVNEQMVIFAKKHKNELLTVLYQEKDKRKFVHNQQKNILRPGRLEIFRILLCRFLNNTECRLLVDYEAPGLVSEEMVEKYLDNELVKFNYELEDVIDFYRLISGKILNDSIPKILCKCGYRPPFCLCNVPEKATDLNKLIIEKE